MERRPTPAERVAEAVRLWGADSVVRTCAETLAADPGEAVTGPALELACVLGWGGPRDAAAVGRAAAWLSGGKPPGHGYWARVWACRAYLYVVHDAAGPAVVAALGDDQWRVRELAAKVIAKREIPDAADQLADLAGADPIPRVRGAACRALAEVGEGEHLDAVAAATADPDRSVAAAAERALARLERRLDRRAG